MVKSKTVDRMEHDSLQLSFQLEVPEISEPLQAVMIWNLKNGVLELNPIFDMRSPYVGL